MRSTRVLPSRLRLAPVLAAVICSGPQAWGQEAPATPASEPAAAAPPAPAQVPDTRQLGADDPLLQQLPPAANQLRNWREALSMVRSQSTSLAIARARVNEARAQSRDSLSKALPQLTATGSVSHHLLYGTGTNLSGSGIATNVDIPDPGTSWRGVLSLRQPVFSYKSWYDIGTSKDRTRVAQLSTSDAERQVLGAVAETLVDLVTAERLAEISAEGLRSALATLSLTERRTALGASSRLDVLRAQQNTSLARAQVIAAREAVLRAREALGMALGTSDGWGVPPGIKLDQLAYDARQLCTRVDTIASRADVQAAEISAQAAGREQKSALYDSLPTVDFVSDVTYSNQNFTANNKPVQWTIGAVLTVPLYDGGSRYALRDRASANVEIARQELTEVKRQAQLEVQQATRAVGVAESNLEVSTKTRDVTKETARLAQVAFVNGSGTSFDLVDTEQQYREAELDLAIKELEVVRARIAALLAQANCNI